jgi:hypothetical protein
MDIIELPNSYIIRAKEITKISFALNKFNLVIVTGVPGIGKSTLAKCYSILNPYNFKEVYFIDGNEFEFDDSKFNLITEKSKIKNERLIIIDGFDGIFSNKTKDKLLRLVNEAKKNQIKLLMTSRNNVFDKVIKDSFFEINLRGLDNEELFHLLIEFDQGKNLSQDIIKTFVEISAKLNNNPLSIQRVLELYNQKRISPEDLLSLIENKLHYQNTIIESFSQDKPLLETPKIISDVRLINSSLIDKVNRNFTLIHNLSSRQFEELVAELFDKEGYKVTMTKETRDGGKDILIIEHKRIGNFIIYVECKRHSMNNPIGVRLVRELFGTVIADRATAGVLITSSYFSIPAIQFKEQVKSQLSLIDYYDLKKWIDDRANH